MYLCSSISLYTKSDPFTVNSNRESGFPTREIKLTLSVEHSAFSVPFSSLHHPEKESTTDPTYIDRVNCAATAVVVN